MVQVQQNDTIKWTAHNADKWVSSRKWADTLELKLSSTADKVTFAKQYHLDTALWKKVFEFMCEHKLEEMAPGKYPIDGDNAFAIITDGPSKEIKDAMWESHQKYIDLQYVIKGKEKIGVVPITDATITKPYDELRDAANYSAKGKYYIAASKIFFLFFPDDVHRPNIIVPGYGIVKKLVIKIRVLKDSAGK
ncbi:YhcH/YjgK/YiaL family protein [Mucilaginibacter sp. X5P1]|uniref:YhcH/YjgK/YiaL family protein n=1 Tax=Mucilaginibacter sp. X5P1 TaxID=2723088 RepID=UPI0016155FF3|nr:YhcH/YjgK/YiaL family protein [Mucilaginibacter sp. X5P1]